MSLAHGSSTRRILGLACLSAMATLLAAVPTAAQQQRPSLNAGRIAGEVFAGAYVGIGGFLIGRYVAEQVSDRVGVTSDLTRRRVGVAGGGLLAGLATAGTVYAIGSVGDQAGDFDATLLGTGVGFVAAMGVARMVLGPLGSPREGMSTAGRWATVNVLALLPAAGAAVGFASTRRSR